MSVKPTISLKYIVTQSKASGFTGLPSLNFSATDLEKRLNKNNSLFNQLNSRYECPRLFS